jgi:hypothetical protein
MVLTNGTMIANPELKTQQAPTQSYLYRALLHRRANREDISDEEVFMDPFKAAENYFREHLREYFNETNE